MKKYKVYITYHFVGGTTLTLTDVHEFPYHIEEKEIDKFIELLFKPSYNYQTSGQTGIAVNMANVTTVEVEFKELDD